MTLINRSLNRRTLLQSAAAGIGLSASGWVQALASQAAADPARKRSCIVLWMSGGPSQLDTFDPKPGHKNGGEITGIPTAAAGVRIGDHLPGVAARMNDLAVIRSMATREGDHGRASQHLRTGYLPQAQILFPVFGSLVAHERHRPENDLPGYISISPRGTAAGALSAGFLGPQFGPLVVGGTGGDDASMGVENLRRPRGIDDAHEQERLALLYEMQAEFLSAHPGTATKSHTNAYEQAVRLMKPSAAKAFDLGEEKAELRDRYGRNGFGQGCLLARRLVERGVAFVEVTLDGWDTHQNNFTAVKNRCGTLDPAWATLMADLKVRGLLESTVVVWMGEFGRTPVINPRAGRDHFPAAWSVVLGGGGIRGGQAVGRTSPDGMTVEDRPVPVPDLIATVCLAMGIDPNKQNMSNVARPIRIADFGAKPVQEVLA